MVDYELEDKKALVVIPFNKEKEMINEMKRLVKEKVHHLKKSGAGLINIKQNADSLIEVRVKLVLGGLSPDNVERLASPLFKKIKVKIKVIQNKVNPKNPNVSVLDKKSDKFPSKNLSDDLSSDSDDKQSKVNSNTRRPVYLDSQNMEKYGQI